MAEASGSAIRDHIALIGRAVPKALTLGEAELHRLVVLSEQDLRRSSADVHAMLTAGGVACTYNQVRAARRVLGYAGRGVDNLPPEAQRARAAAEDALASPVTILRNLPARLRAQFEMLPAAERHKVMAGWLATLG